MRGAKPRSVVVGYRQVEELAGFRQEVGHGKLIRKYTISTHETWTIPDAIYVRSAATGLPSLAAFPASTEFRRRAAFADPSRLACFFARSASIQVVGLVQYSK